MGKHKAQHDPFNPEPRGVRCPSCSGARMQCEADETVRRCPHCKRVERWLQPSRKLLGTRRYQRLLARQQKKFGELDLILPQWVADPEPTDAPPETPPA
ncbi:MAG: hypothetical protein P1P84_05480 [Deferrisomatales bacterium]|nr:hypothetical protein [Deferrisomatales bacterium]